MPDNVDDILKELEAKKKEQLQSEQTGQDSVKDGAVEAGNVSSMEEGDADQHILRQRRDKVSGFKLQLDLDGEMEPSQAATSPVIANAEETSGSGTQPHPVEPEMKVPGEHIAAEPVHEEVKPRTDEEKTGEKEHHKKKAKEKTVWGYIRGFVYAAAVLCVSIVLAYFAIAGGIDLTGLNKSSTIVPVTLTLEQSKSTAKVAKALKDAGVIDQPFIFELYCKLKHVDGKFKPQDQASLSADMGYSAIIGVLRSTKRAVVTVTIPEGTTVDDIAKKLEKNNVCTATDFYMAMNKSASYGFSFVGDIPTDAAHSSQHNKLEGYLFPDTYQFYIGSSGEAAVRKFLDGFQARVDASVQAAAKSKGMTLEDTLTIASIIEWESADAAEMPKVSAVLHNRLNNPSAYPHLECDSTRKFVDLTWPPVNKVKVENNSYDTYKRVGLPVGPINNPGLDAINAAINPDDSMKGYYYFATDPRTKKTYYSKTLAQHEAVCTKYGIGMYSN